MKANKQNTGGGDIVVAKLIESNLRLTQSNYLVFAYMGSVQSVKELDAETIYGDLPDDFLSWPVDDLGTN
ncbi:MAG: hypothetical protein WAK20_05015 [Candidatus Acidiferrum sp.]